MTGPCLISLFFYGLRSHHASCTLWPGEACVLTQSMDGSLFKQAFMCACVQKDSCVLCVCCGELWGVYG